MLSALCGSKVMFFSTLLQLNAFKSLHLHYTDELVLQKLFFSHSWS